MTAALEKKIWNEKLSQEAQSRDALKEIRAQAWKAFQNTGLPDTADESWRYTSTAWIESNEFYFSALTKPSARVLEHLSKSLEPFKTSARIIFVDGWFMPQISDLKPIADSIDFLSMRDLAANRPQALSIHPESLSGFSAMNAALFQDGVWLHVHAGAKPAAGLLIYFLHTSSEVRQTEQLRHFISLGEDSALKITEWHDHLTDAPMFSNQEINIHLAVSAKLEHRRFQQAGANTWMRSSAGINLEQKSHYERLDFEAGAQVSRNEIGVEFSGGESNCILKGIGLGNGSQHFDTQVVINHAVPAASSDQAYRNLLAGKSRGVFGGRVRVHVNAQKTDAKQVHKTLLLSADARADTKPQLEIDADDVQCSHGAAIGQLDEDSLFYLRSRGISLANAEKMLAAGFVEKILDSITDEKLKHFFKDQLKNRLTALFSFNSSEPPAGNISASGISQPAATKTHKQ